MGAILAFWTIPSLSLHIVRLQEDGYVCCINVIINNKLFHVQHNPPLLRGILLLRRVNQRKVIIKQQSHYMKGSARVCGQQEATL